jgi:hypothetical protein
MLASASVYSNSCHESPVPDQWTIAFTPSPETKECDILGPQPRPATPRRHAPASPTQMTCVGGWVKGGHGRGEAGRGMAGRGHGASAECVTNVFEPSSDLSET